MTLRAVGNDIGIFMTHGIGGFHEPLGAANAATVNAAGESVTGIGFLYLSSGSGTTKTFSSAGGKIYWVNGAATWANGSTNVRIGIQDVTATTGLEDGTFDVYDDLVPGVKTISANALNTATMSTGTKDIAHGDLIAISIEMTALGGADSIQPQRLSNTANFPYTTTDTGAGPTKVAAFPLCLVEFDDGTIGYFDALCVPFVSSSISVNSGSTPDEYALIFQVPFKCSSKYLGVNIGEIDTGEDAELILYSDPLGTPVAERTTTIDPDVTALSSGSTGISVYPMSSEYTFAVNTNYAIAYRPTTTGARILRRLQFAIANARYATPFGVNCSEGTRTNQTGAFSAGTTNLPSMGFFANKLDDGVGGGTRAAPFA